MVRRDGEPEGEASPRHEPRGRLSNGKASPHPLPPKYSDPKRLHRDTEPPYTPPVYQIFYRTVDLEGYVHPHEPLLGAGTVDR